MQYDLLLTQNVSAAGTEFSEKYVNLAKGGLLTAIADGTPTVLVGGTDGYHLVRDDAEVTGLKWVAIAGGHTQNTDTGTTNNTFEVSSDGTAGSMLFDGAQAGGDYETKIVNQTQAGNIILTLPAVTGTLATEAYAAGLFAANDALVYKGTVGSGGTIEVAALEALTTYQAGWTYRVKTAGTILGQVMEVGDLITAIVDRAGTGNDVADWTFIQTNHGALGTMAYETATNYVAKALFDANTVLFAASDNTPAALLGTELFPKLWAEVPADKIGTGWTGTAIAGQMARDANFIYLCTTGGAATSQAWKRSVLATNW